METRGMEVLYQRIANLVNEMVPEDWNKILLYAEVREGYSQVYFYYYPEANEEPVYSLDIPEQFNIDKKSYKKTKLELYECCEELWEQFKSNTGEAWTSLTFVIESTGAFKTTFEYDDLSQLSTVDKKHNWEAKYLGKK